MDSGLGLSTRLGREASAEIARCSPVAFELLSERPLCREPCGGDKSGCLYGSLVAEVQVWHGESSLGDPPSVDMDTSTQS